MAGFEARPWKAVPSGLAVTVRATPKGGRDAIEGVIRLADGRPVLKVRVRAAPAGGEANAAIMRLLARAAGVSPAAVTLIQGATARLKIVRLAGDPAALASMLEQAIGTQESRTR